VLLEAFGSPFFAFRFVPGFLQVAQFSLFFWCISPFSSHFLRHTTPFRSCPFSALFSVEFVSFLSPPEIGFSATFCPSDLWCLSFLRKLLNVPFRLVFTVVVTSPTPVGFSSHHVCVRGYASELPLSPSSKRSYSFYFFFFSSCFLQRIHPFLSPLFLFCIHQLQNSRSPSPPFF